MAFIREIYIFLTEHMLLLWIDLVINNMHVRKSQNIEMYILQQNRTIFFHLMPVNRISDLIFIQNTQLNLKNKHGLYSQIGPAVDWGLSKKMPGKLDYLFDNYPKLCFTDGTLSLPMANEILEILDFRGPFHRHGLFDTGMDN